MSAIRRSEEWLAEQLRRREQEAFAQRERRALAGCALRALDEPPRPQPMYRSKAEAEHAQWLEVARRAGQIARWRYETLTLVVGEGAGKKKRLTPDFWIEHMDGSMGLDEVKGGFVREDAIAKLMAAVLLYPGFKWRLCSKVKGTWTIKPLN